MVSIAEKLLLLLDGSAQQPFVTATTTTASESVTIDRLTPASGSLVIDWGDGDTTTVNAGDTGSKSHTYASAGSYAITVDDYDNIQQIRLSSSKLFGFNTALLANAPVTYFFVSAGTNFTINSADMSSWTPSEFQLYSMPSGGTYTIDSSDMSSWTPSVWYLHSMPSGGTYTIDTSDMSSWNPLFWLSLSMPAGTHTFAAGDFSNWNSIRTFRAENNSLSQASVDEIITGFHALISTNTWATPNVNVGGTNAAPSASPEIDTYIPALQSDGWTITYTTP